MSECIGISSTAAAAGSDYHDHELFEIRVGVAVFHSNTDNNFTGNGLANRT
jgi:hypothetical protein